MPAVPNTLTTLRVLLLIYGLALGAQTAGVCVVSDQRWNHWLLQCILMTLATVACGMLVVTWSPAAWRWAVGSAAVLFIWQLSSAVAEGAAGQGIGQAAGQGMGQGDAADSGIVWDVAWTLGDHAPRMAIPLALAWIWNILASSNAECVRTQRLRHVAWLLSGAAAAMFFMHGWKLLFDPTSVEVLLTRSLGRWNGYQLQPETVRAVLTGIGVVHWLAVSLLLWGRPRVPLYYMALWGMMTSLSRISAYGLFAWDEAFLRAANGGAAWAALFLLPPREPCCDESSVHPKDRTTRSDSDR